MIRPARVLAALAEPNRLRLFRLLGKDNWSVGALSEELGLTSQTVSFHLKRLIEAGCCEAFYRGRHTFISRNALVWQALAPALGLSDATPSRLDIRVVSQPAKPRP